MARAMLPPSSPEASGIPYFARPRTTIGGAEGARVDYQLQLEVGYYDRQYPPEPIGGGGWMDRPPEVEAYGGRRLVEHPSALPTWNRRQWIKDPFYNWRTAEAPVPLVLTQRPQPLPRGMPPNASGGAGLCRERLLPGPPASGDGGAQDLGAGGGAYGPQVPLAPPPLPQGYGGGSHKTLPPRHDDVRFGGPESFDDAVADSDAAAAAAAFAEARMCAEASPGCAGSAEYNWYESPPVVVKGPRPRRRVCC